MHYRLSSKSAAFEDDLTKKYLEHESRAQIFSCRKGLPWSTGFNVVGSAQPSRIVHSGRAMEPTVEGI